VNPISFLEKVAMGNNAIAAIIHVEEMNEILSNNHSRKKVLSRGALVCAAGVGSIQARLCSPPMDSLLLTTSP
jgi:hypothetical protein